MIMFLNNVINHLNPHIRMIERTSVEKYYPTFGR